jgi:hypothetical protein
VSGIGSGSSVVAVQYESVSSRSRTKRSADSTARQASFSPGTAKNSSAVTSAGLGFGRVPDVGTAAERRGAHRVGVAVPQDREQPRRQRLDEVDGRDA